MKFVEEMEMNILAKGIVFTQRSTSHNEKKITLKSRENKQNHGDGMGKKNQNFVYSNIICINKHKQILCF